VTSVPTLRAILRTALVCAVPLAVTTLLVWVLETVLGLSDASPAYLLAVTGVAVLLGTLPAVLTAVAAFGVYNFLFTHPRFTFIVADSAQLLNLVLLLVVGVVVGQLAGAQRGRAEEAERREREARVLFQVTRALATRSSTGSALQEIVEILRQNAALAAAWIGIGASPGTERPLTAAPAGHDPAAAHVALQRRPGEEPARWMRVLPAARLAGLGGQRATAYRIAIEGGGAPLGSLWVVPSKVEGEPERNATRMLAAAADQIGLALEQDRLRREATSAELARQSEAMKSALLESVSHDLRTPLAAIRAAAGVLLDPAADEVRREQALAIDADAARMDRLVSNLLDISRIEAGGLTVDLQPYPLDDLVTTSLRRFRAELGNRLAVEVPPDLPYVSADAILLDQALANVLENAIRYAPGAAIRVCAAVDGQRVRLQVDDDGPGVPDDALPRLFEKFYRVGRPRETARRGTGIGLSVVRGLLQAMGGDAEARHAQGGGLSLIMHLPVAELPADDVEGP
jgi:two-component system sensor histidine kinase KdpD